jgi:hypothetical protein
MIMERYARMQTGVGLEYNLPRSIPRSLPVVNDAAFCPVLTSPYARSAGCRTTGAPLFASPLAPLQYSYTVRPFRRGFMDIFYSLLVLV